MTIDTSRHYPFGARPLPDTPAIRGALARIKALRSQSSSRGLVQNAVPRRSGLVAAVCCCCGKTSRAVAADCQGEPDLFEIPRGWSQAPFPCDYQHDDGSVGSTYHCPTCNGKLRNGHALRRRAYLLRPTTGADETEASARGTSIGAIHA